MSSETVCSSIAGVENDLTDTMKIPIDNCDDGKENHSIKNQQLDNSELIINKMEKSTKPIDNRQRICLIGSVCNDEPTILAAQSFNVPVLTSETGAEYIADTEWTTYFVMNAFDGEHFDAIRKSKHRIYGPTALQQVAQSDDGLTYVNRPIYNFAMKGVITCFTGIRKKDELTRLVNLIHAMGGSIRKELNSRVTHLICNSSSGEKYQYAMTFRLTVVRADWVYAAWEQRDNAAFFATESDFSRIHRLKPFEGHRVCFYGFSPEEHQEMVEILKLNGGIPTDFDDPDCSHVILANNVDHFPEQMAGPTSPPLTTITPNLMNASTATPSVANHVLPPEGLENLNLNEVKSTIVDTPKKPFKLTNENSDGIILPGNEENQFLEPTNLSPILHNIEEEEENGDDANDKEMSKRKRDSFDNISIISTDTFAAQFSSAKKPKLIRTGSLKRSLRRTMSFATNPITNMIRQRRNSIDPNASISSITSMESTFSESIKRPVKEKLQSLRDRITHANRSKREFCLTPRTTKKLQNPHIQTAGDNDDDNKFIPPNEISMLSCRKLMNSTMNTTVAIEAATSEAIDEQQPIKKNEKIENDVADSAALVSTATPIQSIVSMPPEKPDIRNANTHILKSEWFWFTIQNGYANEMDYLFCDYLDSLAANTPGGDRRESLPPGIKRKRKRFSILGASGKRRSSVSDAGLSVSGSFLDCTSSPNINREASGKSLMFRPKKN